MPSYTILEITYMMFSQKCFLSCALSNQNRGAPTNYHPGNEFFRDLVKEYQSTYLTSKRADKPFVASHIVNIIQSRGGRFLRRYKRNGVSWERGHFVWVEVDPQKAYEKACQALREGAPEIRRKLAVSGSGTEEDVEDDEDDELATTEKRTKSPPGTASRPFCDVTSSSAAATAEQRETGERVEETEKETTRNEASASAGGSSPSKPAAATTENSDDDRNDDMQNSERS